MSTTSTTTAPAAAGAGTPARPAATLFASKIADASTNLEALGFKSSLWVPDWDIPAGEEEAFEPPHEPQLLAALQVFAWLFVATVGRVWVHIAAEMQAGKTGVIAAVARLVLSNAKRLGFSPTRIFVVTGMSDEAWQTQTAPRLPGILRDNLHHGGILSQVSEKLKRLARGEHLANVLIFIDESHYASSASNQPAKHIYNVVAELCPIHLWAERNIRFVTISATDPAKVLAMKSSNVATKVVRLYTTDAYQSVEKLQSLNRLRYLEQVPGNGTLHTDTGFAAMTEAVRSLESEHGPLIHILRPNHKHGSTVARKLNETFPGAVVHQWDVASNKEKLRKSKDDESSSVGSVTDINKAILEVKPTKTTFVILKGMFRAAKTLNDRYVGVLYDRAGAADATNLQSLLGRACGYGKSTRTVIFTSRSTVDNYIRLWRELCASKDFPTEIPEGTPSDLKGRMPGVSSVRASTGGSKLVATVTHATPLGSGLGVATAEERAASARATLDDDNYEVVWSQEFSTVEALMASSITRGEGPKMGENGFYKNATGNKKPMSRAQLMALKAGKKTAHLRVELKVGKTSKRTFPFYENTGDASTVRFVVRTLTRLR